MLLVAGTQVSCSYNTPGMTVADELNWQTDGGYTPAEALRSATINSARMLCTQDSLGTVSSRKLADLVLLDANPLQDIVNVRRVRAVITDGRLLDRPALDVLLARARKAVARAK